MVWILSLKADHPGCSPCAGAEGSETGGLGFSPSARGPVLQPQDLLRASKPDLLSPLGNGAVSASFPRTECREDRDQSRHE